MEKRGIMGLDKDTEIVRAIGEGLKQQRQVQRNVSDCNLLSVSCTAVLPCALNNSHQCRNKETHSLPPTPLTGTKHAPVCVVALHNIIIKMPYAIIMLEIVCTK